MLWLAWIVLPDHTFCDILSEQLTWGSLNPIQWSITTFLISTQRKELHVPTPVYVLTLVKLWEVRRLMECCAYILGSKIAKPAQLMSIYGIVKWFKRTGDIMFALAQHIRMPTYPMAFTFFFFFCMNLISTSAVLSCLHCFWGLAVQTRPYFTPKSDSGWVILLVFSSSRLSLEDTQQWSQSLERLLESKCRFAFSLGWRF